MFILYIYICFKIRRKQADVYEFEASLDYKVSSRTARTTTQQNSVLIKPRNKYFVAHICNPITLPITLEAEVGREAFEINVGYKVATGTCLSVSVCLSVCLSIYLSIYLSINIYLDI